MYIQSLIHSNNQSFSDTLKCGEVLICKRTENFIFICDFCNEHSKGVHKFLKHIKHHHSVLNERNDCEIKNDLDGENQIFIKSEHCERNFSQPIETKNIDTIVSENNPVIEFIDENDDNKTLKNNKKGKQKEIEKLNITCEICDKKFNSERTKRLHLKYDHESPDPFLSTSADNDRDDDNNDGDDDDNELRSKIGESVTKVFAQPIGVDPYTCKYCKKKFKERAIRADHERIHTGEKPFKCEFCDKSFRLNSYYKNHVLAHKGIKRHKCDTCDAAFSHKTNLNTHIRTHTGDKRYQCKHCEKSFTHSSAKNIHERTHTGEKPYQCNICGMCFASYARFSGHISKHSNERPFKCNDCDKSFSSKDTLRRHAIVHSNERPFKCDVCSATFPRSKSLRAHSKLHSTVAEYVCEICGKGFKQFSGLYSHMKSHGGKLTKSSLVEKQMNE